MGILDFFRASQAVDTVDRIAAAMTPAVVDPSALPIASPWSSSHLQRLVVEDVFGSELPINTRAAAMRLDPVARGRNLLVTAGSGLPLRELDETGPVTEQPAWLSRVDGGASPEHRMAWTIDDLIFYGWSCWTKVAGEGGARVPGARVNMGDWSINADNRVEIHGVVQSDDQVLLIPGLHEGILSYGVDVLEDARSLSRIVRQRLNNPVPQLELHQTGGTPLTRPEIEQLVADWTKARLSANGGVGFTNEHIEVKEHGAGGEQLMIEARNASAVSLARIIGVHAGLLDATTPKSSLNYETATGRNGEFVDFDLPLYLTPIQARLSLDDVCAPGRRVRFDTTDLVSLAPSPTGPTTGD